MHRLIPTLALFLLLVAPRVLAQPVVVADIAPVHAIASAVMEGIGEPALLIDGPSDPHHASLRPSQRRLLADADLLVMVGGGLTPWLDKLAGTPRAAMALIDVTGTTLLDGESGQIDPHAWLSPANAQVWARAIAGRLADDDPANAERYRRNADVFAASVAAVAHEAALLLDGKSGGIVTSHDALAYFARSFGLEIVGAIATSDDTPPSAGRIAALRQQAEAGAVACVMIEAGDPPGRASAITEGLPVRTAQFDPLGVSLTRGPTLYRELILGLARAVSDCLEPGAAG